MKKLIVLLSFVALIAQSCASYTECRMVDNNDESKPAIEKVAKKDLKA